VDFTLTCNIKHEDELKNLTKNLVIASTTVSGTSLILRLMDRRNDAFPARVATQATAIGFLFSVNVLFGPLVNFRQLEEQSKYGDLCVVQGVLFEFFALGLVGYWLFICILTFRVVVHRTAIRRLIKQERYFHLSAWPTCLFFTFLPVCLHGPHVYGPLSGISSCWLEEVQYQTAYLYAFMAAVLLIAVGLSVKILARFISLVYSDPLPPPSLPSPPSSMSSAPSSRATSQEARDEEAADMLDPALAPTSPHTLQITASEAGTATPTPFRHSSPAVLGRQPLKAPLLPETQASGVANSRTASAPSTAIRYHLIRHVLFLVLFAFVFIAALLDSLNRWLDQSANSESQAMSARFPAGDPCTTTYLATVSTSCIGTFVGVVFCRWPRPVVDRLRRLRQRWLHSAANSAAEPGENGDLG